MYLMQRARASERAGVRVCGRERERERAKERKRERERERKRVEAHAVCINAEHVSNAERAREKGSE